MLSVFSGQVNIIKGGKGDNKKKGRVTILWQCTSTQHKGTYIKFQVNCRVF